MIFHLKNKPSNIFTKNEVRSSSSFRFLSGTFLITLQIISDLKKEVFNLKVKLFHMEEQLRHLTSMSPEKIGEELQRLSTEV